MFKKDILRHFAQFCSNDNSCTRFSIIIEGRSNINAFIAKAKHFYVKNDEKLEKYENLI